MRGAEIFDHGDGRCFWGEGGASRRDFGWGRGGCSTRGQEDPTLTPTQTRETTPHPIGYHFQQTHTGGRPDCKVTPVRRTDGIETYGDGRGTPTGTPTPPT